MLSKTSWLRSFKRLLATQPRRPRKRSRPAAPAVSAEVMERRELMSVNPLQVVIDSNIIGVDQSRLEQMGFDFDLNLSGLQPQALAKLDSAANDSPSSGVAVADDLTQLSFLPSGPPAAPEVAIALKFPIASSIPLGVRYSLDAAPTKTATTAENAGAPAAKTSNVLANGTFSKLPSITALAGSSEQPAKEPLPNALPVDGNLFNAVSTPALPTAPGDVDVDPYGANGNDQTSAAANDAAKSGDEPAPQSKGSGKTLEDILRDAGLRLPSDREQILRDAGLLPSGNEANPQEGRSGEKDVGSNDTQAGQPTDTDSETEKTSAGKTLDDVLRDLKRRPAPAAPGAVIGGIDFGDRIRGILGPAAAGPTGTLTELRKPRVELREDTVVEGDSTLLIVELPDGEKGPLQVNVDREGDPRVTIGRSSNDRGAIASVQSRAATIPKAGILALQIDTVQTELEDGEAVITVTAPGFEPAQVRLKVKDRTVLDKPSTPPGSILAPASPAMPSEPAPDERAKSAITPSTKSGEADNNNAAPQPVPGAEKDFGGKDTPSAPSSGPDSQPSGTVKLDGNPGDTFHLNPDRNLDVVITGPDGKSPTATNGVTGEPVPPLDIGRSQATFKLRRGEDVQVPAGSQVRLRSDVNNDGVVNDNDVNFFDGVRIGTGRRSDRVVPFSPGDVNGDGRLNDADRNIINGDRGQSLDDLRIDREPERKRFFEAPSLNSGDTAAGPTVANDPQMLDDLFGGASGDIFDLTDGPMETGDGLLPPGAGQTIEISDDPADGNPAPAAGNQGDDARAKQGPSVPRYTPYGPEYGPGFLPLPGDGANPPLNGWTPGLPPRDGRGDSGNPMTPPGAAGGDQKQGDAPSNPTTPADRSQDNASRPSDAATPNNPGNAPNGQPGEPSGATPRKPLWPKPRTQPADAANDASKPNAQAPTSEELQAMYGDLYTGYGSRRNLRHSALGHTLPRLRRSDADTRDAQESLQRHLDDEAEAWRKYRDAYDAWEKGSGSRDDLDDARDDWKQKFDALDAENRRLKPRGGYGGYWMPEYGEEPQNPPPGAGWPNGYYVPEYPQESPQPRRHYRYAPRTEGGPR